MDQGFKILKLKYSGSGFRSACDFPSSTYFEDLLRLYPNAKVILTIRDTPQQWINSVKDTIFAEKFGNGNKFSGKLFKKISSVDQILESWLIWSYDMGHIIWLVRYGYKLNNKLNN